MSFLFVALIWFLDKCLIGPDEFLPEIFRIMSHTFFDLEEDFTDVISPRCFLGSFDHSTSFGSMYFEII